MMELLTLLLHTCLFLQVLAFSIQECKEADGFWCSSTKVCLGMRLLCDNYSDCTQGEDETDCNATYKGAISEALCVNGGYWCRQSAQCVSLSERCDKKRDCRLNEDERMCSSSPEGHGHGHRNPCSSSGDFWCEKSRTCTAKVNRCDRFIDCFYGEDERDCSYGGGFSAGSTSESPEALACAKDSKMWCRANNVCLSNIKICDRKVDCNNGEDEKSCSYVSTTPTAFNLSSEVTTQKHGFTATMSAISGVSGFLIVVLVSALVRLCCCKKSLLPCRRVSVSHQESCSSRETVETVVSGGNAESSLDIPGHFTSEPPLYSELIASCAPTSQDAEEPPAYVVACEDGSACHEQVGQ